jgi:hypothetical protein
MENFSYRIKLEENREDTLEMTKYNCKQTNFTLLEDD